MGGFVQRARAATTGVKRQLLGAPLYTTSMTLSVALGLAGANATFRVFDALALRPLAGVRDPGELVRVYYDHSFSRSPRASMKRMSYPMYRHMTEASADPMVFAGSWTKPGSWQAGEVVRPIGMIFVSPNYFEVLQTWPGRGSRLSDALRQPGSVVVTAATMKALEELGSGVIGAQMAINGRNLTVAAVLPAAFDGLDAGDLKVYLPLADLMLFDEDARIFESYGSSWIEVIGRIPKGLDREKVSRKIEDHLRRLGDIEGPPGRRTLRLAGLNSVLGPEQSLADKIVVLLAILAGLMLVSTLLNTLAISSTRWLGATKALGIRTALGATHGDIALMVALEAGVLSLAGAGIGLMTSALVEPLLRLLVSEPTGVLHPRVLAVTLACLLLHVPAALGALASVRIDALAITLRSHAGHIVHRPRQLHGAVLTLQVAAGYCLIVGALGIGRKFGELSQTDLGFDPNGLWVISLRPGSANGEGTMRDVLRLARSSPMSSMTAVADAYPFGNRYMLTVQSNSGTHAMAAEARVSGEYFDAMRIRLIAGRTFTREEVETHAPVVIVSKSLSDLVVGGDAIGACLRSESGPCLRVVGVSADLRQVALEAPPEPAIFRPLNPSEIDERSHVIVRVQGAEVARPFVRDLQSTTRPPGMLHVRSIVDLMAPMLAPWRLASTFVSFLSLVSVLLIALGTFALARLVGQESIRENALRMLLGATPAAIRRRAFIRGFVTCVIGLTLGIAVTGAVLALLAGLLPFADALGVGDVFIALLILVTTTAFALVGPARLAASGKPTQLL